MTNKNANERIRLENKNRRLLLKIEKSLNLRKYLKSGSRHLDFGCGYGFFSKALAEKYPKISFEGLDKDKKKIKDADIYRKLKNIQYVCSDKLTGKHDSVSANLVLHETDKLNKLLKEIRRVLKDNGIIIVYDFRRTTEKKFKKLFVKGGFDGSFDEEYAEHNKWTLKEFEGIMKRAGFKEITLKEDGDYFLMYLGEKNE